MLPSCRHFPTCGGCQILDLEYSEQLVAKEEELRRHFSAWPELNISPMLPSPKVFGYRHKVQLPFGHEERGKEWKEMKRQRLGPNAPAVLATLGCYAAGTHSVVDQDECLVQDAGLSQVAWAVKAWANQTGIPIYKEATGMGWLRHLLLRRGAKTGEILLGIVTNGIGALSQPSLTDLVDRIKAALLLTPKALGGEMSDTTPTLIGIVQNINTMRNNVVLGEEEHLLWGQSHLREYLGDFSFSVGMSTFFQVNPFQTPRLYNLAVEAIPENSAVLDLFSGMGTIALWASQRSRKVLGIESNKNSISAARIATQENGVSNVNFMESEVTRALTEESELLSEFEVAIVDPPRKGLEVRLKEALEKLNLKRLIYVSCFPPTLARDTEDLAKTFRLISVSPVDMFPHTRHIECVAIFDRI